MIATLSWDPQPSPPPDDECMLENVPVVVLQERHVKSMLQMGSEPSQRNDLDLATELVNMAFFQFDII